MTIPVNSKLIDTDGDAFGLQTADGAPIFSSKEWLIDVARGLVPGASFERKFGSIDAIQSATPADVWEYGVTSGAEKYTFSSTADITTLSSSNVGDSVEMTVVGLIDDGTELTQFINLNGQNKVTLPVPYWRVNRMYNNNGIDLLGNVYCYVDGAITNGVPDDPTTVRAYVSIGEGQTLQAIYTVPAHKTAYFVGHETSITKGVGSTAVSVNCRGRTRDFGKVFRTQDEFSLLSSGVSNKHFNVPIPLPFPEKTDFVTAVESSANNVGASWSFFLILIDN
jgi:hypothetical protein